MMYSLLGGEQTYPGFELQLPISFPPMISIILSIPPFKAVNLKSFNCFATGPVSLSLSLTFTCWLFTTRPISLFLSLTLTCNVNTLVCGILQQSNTQNAPPHNAFLYRFLADRNLHMRWDVGSTNCTPNDAHVLFFCTSCILHARYIRAIFELQGRPFCSSLLVSFFRCCSERNSIHTASLSHFISCSLGSPPVLFYPAVYDCWIHVNNSTSLMVPLNDESQLAHQR